MSQELARKLKAVRDRLGISQAAMAERLKTPADTYRKWEQDQSTPRGFALTALNDALDRILRKG